jgi:hypothetical protein
MSADTEAKDWPLSENGLDVVTPELALVDPELAKAQRQLQRKAAMSSNLPADGTFFVDPAQPAAQPGAPEPIPVLAPPAPAEPAQPPAAVAPPALKIPEGDGASMRDVPLGTLIFRAGLLAEEQLEDALQEGMRTGKRLGEVLLERGWLHERDLGRLLAGQKGLPFVEVSAWDAEPAALERLPEEKARMQVALPLRIENGQVVVAVSDPSNELVIENLRRALGSEPELVVAPHSELQRAIGEAYDAAKGQPVPAMTPEPVPQPETLLQAPAPVEVPNPAPVQPEISIQTPPLLVPEAQPAAALSPIVEHEPAQPAPPPAVTPLPTVLPPAEERAPEPPPAIQPLTPTPVESPVAPPSTPAAPPPAPAAVAPEEPAPQPQPQPVVPVAPEPPTALAAEIAAAMPPPEPIPVPQTPLAPPPVAESTPEPPPAPQPDLPPAAQEPATVHVVSIRLREGETIQVGTYGTAEEAAARAQEVVASIAAAEGNATWPYFERRYLRPDTITSVDLVEELAEKWLGSAARSRWANPE